MNEEQFDVIVVGGGAAGLSAALILARSRRKVLVIDAGEPRNARAGHVHGYLGREGTPPAELTAIGRSEVESYGGKVRSGRAVRAFGNRGDFTVEFADGTQLRARRLIMATGLTDVLPDIEGIETRWGRDVLHCPYCHGWEVRDQRVGVIANPVMPTHAAQLFRQLTDRVVLFTAGSEFSEEQLSGLRARDIQLAESAVVSVEVQDDALTGVRLVNGEVVGLDALVVAPRLAARSEVAESLGTEMTDTAFGRQITVGAMGATSVAGVWVAGNASNPMAQVIISAGEGLMAGAIANADLVEEDILEAAANFPRPGEETRTQNC